jgi:hypothetical protein
MEKKSPKNNLIFILQKIIMWEEVQDERNTKLPINLTWD